MRRHLALVVMLGAAAPAPAAPLAATPLSDAELLDYEPDPLPPAADPAPRERAGLASAPDDRPLDASLLRFASLARDRRTRGARRQGFPAPALAAWDELAAELGEYLARDTSRTPLAELVRARVTVEAELELDRRRFGAPPPELEERLDASLRALARRAEAARALGQTLFVVTRPPALRWPVEDAGLSSLYGMRHHPLDGVRRMHWGIDLAAATGRPVGAAARGFVVHAGFTAGYGLTVEVRHDGELTSRYAHLSTLLCGPGDRVEPGQPLGLVGATGRTTGPHLHFELWRGGRAEDPLPLLRTVWARAPLTREARSPRGLPR
jgi:murein DD-endopeptidase MepM/ murein hydrolase activator NlpD